MEAVQDRLFNPFQVDTIIGENGHPSVEVNTVPPPWDSEKPLVPGQRHLQVKAPPLTTLRVVHDCFTCKLAAEVDKESWALHVTAFLDYEAVRLKVEICRNPDSDAHTDMIFHHIFQDDLVQFSHVCFIVLDHLCTSNLQVLASEGVRGFLPVLMDGEFYDDPFELEEDWPAMLASVLKAADSLAASERELGVQALARWAERRQDCIPALVDALLEHSDLVGRLLRAPLAECYPLAVALKIASGCPRGAERLAGQILPLMPWLRAGLPPLVARELEKAFGDLTMAIPNNEKGGKGAKRLEKPMKVVADVFSRASTCEPVSTSTYEFSELGEELATDLLWESEDP